jgi:hypothetical protein
MLVLLLLTVALFEPPASSPGPPNPIVIENQKPSTADWEISDPALEREIEGYAASTSVNRGDAIDLFVSTRDPRYTIDVFRMGWYGGRGARRVAGPLEQPGIAQEVPPPDPVTGLVECHWRNPVRIVTNDDDGAWTSGVYLARLTARPSGKQSFIVFVVRDDGRDSGLVFQSSITTFAAYNNWGGKSLYAFNSGDAPARKVSLDRPYAMNPYGIRLDGAGDFLRRWEYNAVRFLEREGYDVSYITDVDTHQAANLLQHHVVFLSVGHDEYWSPAMRTHVEDARGRGVHLAFLGAGACYWRIRFEPNSAGRADRTIVGYKERANDEDPLARDGNAANDRSITGRWRDRPRSRPEEGLIGIMYAADPVDGDIIVDEASHWAFAGTGLKRGDALPGLLGYEVDAIYGEGPAGLVRLAHSPFGDRGKKRHAEMTLYTAESGAIVFATGSMQWNWGLDGYNAPQWHSLRTREAAQQVTRNILDRMLQGRGRSLWPMISRSNTVVLTATVVAGLLVLRAWISSRMGRRGLNQ